MADVDYTIPTPTGWVRLEYTGTNSNTIYHLTDDAYCTIDRNWTDWCQTKYSNTMAATETCWTNWVTLGGGTGRVRTAQFPDQRQVKEATAEEAAAQIARIEASRIAQAARDKLQTEVLQRSKRLLLELLDEQQTKDLEEKHVFRVIGQDGQVYEVNARECHGNIHRLDKEGKKVENFCVPMSGGLPRFDQIVAQVLALQCNLEHIAEKANRYLILPSGATRAVAKGSPIAVAG